MSNVAYDYMEEFITNLIPEHQGILYELELYAKENNVPIIHKEVANFLAFMVNMKRPKRILELGTAIGYSSIVMFKSANDIERIDTIERDPEMIKIAEENIKRTGLEGKINIIEGDCLEVLDNLREAYDLIFVDAGKGHYNHFHPHCLRLLSDEGIIFADNVLYKGMVASDELVNRRKITIVKRMREYLQMISEDKSLITSIIPMGDGIAVMKRRKQNE